MTITPKTYSHCPKKHAARQSTIIDPYRSLYSQSVPTEKQYWSMCAFCANEKGTIEGSELHQLIDSQLIQNNQFHGVDMNQEIYNQNSKYAQSNWYCNDFLAAMEESYSQNNFNPAIVNADLINMPVRAAAYAASILDFLVGAKMTDTMVVLNVVLKTHNRFSSTEQLIESLKENSLFQIVWSKKIWSLFGSQLYQYNGTDSGKKKINDKANPKTIMGTIVFVPSNRLNNVD